MWQNCVGLNKDDYSYKISEVYCCPSCGAYVLLAGILKYPEKKICKRCGIPVESTGFYMNDIEKEVGDDGEREFLFENFLYKNPKYNPEKHKEYVNYLNSPEFILDSKIAHQRVLDEIDKEMQEKRNKVKCPRCGSTQIQMVTRKWGLFSGIFTNKVDRVCVKCKHKF